MLTTQRIGDGPNLVVVLHGFLGSGRNLYSLARRWSQLDPSRSFLLTDLTGHGSSPPLPPDADLFTMARDVLETAKAQRLVPPFEIVGHSLGGRVALAAILLEPKALSSVTILDIAPGPIDDEPWGSGALLAKLMELPETTPDRGIFRERLLATGLSQGLTDWALMNLIPAEGGGYQWRIDRDALAALHGRTNAQDLWAAVEGREVSTRCVRGGKSRYVTEEDRRRMEAAGCEVATLPESGHYPHVDEPQKLLDLLAGSAPWQ